MGEHIQDKKTGRMKGMKPGAGVVAPAPSDVPVGMTGSKTAASTVVAPDVYASFRQEMALRDQVITPEGTDLMVATDPMVSGVPADEAALRRQMADRVDGGAPHVDCDCPSCQPHYQAAALLRDAGPPPMLPASTGVDGGSGDEYMWVREYHDTSLPDQFFGPDTEPELDHIAVVPGTYVGMTRMAGTPEATAMIAATNDLRVPLAGAPVPDLQTSVDEMTAWRQRVAHARAVCDEMEQDLAARLDGEGVHVLQDHRAGILVEPVGGRSYSGWNHGDLTAVLSDVIRARIGVSADKTRMVLDAYRSYATTPSYYRAKELRAMGLRPADYAVVTPEPRRLNIENRGGAETSATDAAVGARGAMLMATGERVAQALDGLAALRTRIAGMSTVDAVREYAAASSRVALVKRAVDDLEDRAVALAHTGALTRVTASDGTVYTLKRGTTSTVFDLDATRPQVLDQVTRETGVRYKDCVDIVDEYEKVARVSGFKIRELTSRTGIDVDAVTSKKTSRDRLVAP